MSEPSSYRCSIFPFGPAYSTPGCADATLAHLNESGGEAAQLFQISLLYYRGEYQAAAGVARALLQTDLSFEGHLFACHTLALEAMYLGDDQKWLASRQLLSQTEFASPRQQVQIAFHIAAMDSGIYVKTSFPAWFREGTFDPLPVTDYPFARYIYAKLLYMENSYDKLTAVVGTLISQSKAEKALMSEIYLRIVAAMGYHSLGDESRVEKQLREALALALPDRLYAPFAESRRNLGVCVDQLLQEADPEGLKKVQSLTAVILNGWTKLYNRLYGKTISNEMTPREYDVARLVLHGLTNKEIADRLNLSVNTVKLYLRVIFEKFGINRREELSPYVWEEASPLPKKAHVSGVPDSAPPPIL